MNSPPSKTAGSLWEAHPQMTAAMLAALAENPLTAGMSETMRLGIVELAIKEKRFNDATWLTNTVHRLQRGEILLEPSTADEATAAPSWPRELTPLRAAATADPAAAAAPGTPLVPAVPEIPVSRPVRIHSQEELDAVLDAHADWMRQVLEPGAPLGAGRANLKGNDLRAFQLEGCDLRAANLEACDLRGCSLIASKLAGANLSRAQLAGARLDKARLRRANLSGADLSGASLVGADLRQVVLQGAKLEGCDLSDTVLAPPPLESPKTS